MARFLQQSYFKAGIVASCYSNLAVNDEVQLKRGKKKKPLRTLAKSGLITEIEVICSDTCLTACGICLIGYKNYYFTSVILDYKTKRNCLKLFQMSLLSEKRRNKYVKVLFPSKNKAIVMLKTTATTSIIPQKYFILKILYTKILYNIY